MKASAPGRRCALKAAPPGARVGRVTGEPTAMLRIAASSAAKHVELALCAGQPRLEIAGSRGSAGCWELRPDELQVPLCRVGQPPELVALPGARRTVPTAPARLTNQPQPVLVPVPQRPLAHPRQDLRHRADVTALERCVGLAAKLGELCLPAIVHGESFPRRR